MLAPRPHVSVNPIMFEKEPGGERTSVAGSIGGVVLARRADVSVNPIMFEEEPGGERTSKTIL